MAYIVTFLLCLTLFSSSAVARVKRQTPSDYGTTKSNDTNARYGITKSGYIITSPPVQRSGSACKIVAFGNSLTDDGIDHDDSHGFRKYSNGPVWPDYISQMLGCGCVDNYAYSGALSNMDNYYFKGWSGTLWQVEVYLKSHFPSPSTIIGFECGGLNDLFLIIGNETAHDKVEKDVVTNNILGLETLLKAGASRIIVIDVYEPESHAPATEEEWFKPYVPTFEKSISTINKELEKKVAELKARYQNALIALVKTTDFWDEIVKKFPEHKKPYTHHTNDAKWGEWKKYAWYDEYHLTTDLHRFLAEKAQKAFIEA